MTQKRLKLLVGLFVFSAFIVCGSAIAGNMLFKSFLLPEGLFDWGYFHLILSLFLPVCLYAVASHKGSKHTGKVAFSALGLAGLIYAPVFLTHAAESSIMTSHSHSVLCLATLGLVSVMTVISYVSLAYTKKRVAKAK